MPKACARHHQADINLIAVDTLLVRWANWLKAGTSPLHCSVIGSYDERIERTQDGYRDAGAEFIDQVLAGLPWQMRESIMLIYYHGHSERVTAGILGLGRSAWATVHNNALRNTVNEIKNRMGCNGFLTVAQFSIWVETRGTEGKKTKLK